MSGQFTTANAEQSARNGHIARKATSARTSYSQAVKLQTLIIKDAIGHDEAMESDVKEVRESARPTDLAALARAWCDLEETKRKLKMKPLPGSLRPTSAKPQRRSKQPDFEPSPAPQTTSHSESSVDPCGPSPKS